MHDWEDMATFQDANGECFLYIGDIGNNTRSRDVFTIYRVKEPKVSDADKDSSKKNPRKTENAEAIKFEYPDIRRDAETLMVNPKTATFTFFPNASAILPAFINFPQIMSLNKTNKLEKIADFKVPAIPNGLLTGGDISPDGKRVIICDYFNAYEITLPEKAKNFDEIWKQKPLIVELGERANKAKRSAIRRTAKRSLRQARKKIRLLLKQKEN